MKTNQPNQEKLACGALNMRLAAVVCLMLASIMATPGSSAQWVEGIDDLETPYIEGQCLEPTDDAEITGCLLPSGLPLDCRGATALECVEGIEPPECEEQDCFAVLCVMEGEDLWTCMDAENPFECESDCELPDPCENPEDCENPHPCPKLADCLPNTGIDCLETGSCGDDLCENPGECEVDTYDPLEIQTQCSKIMMLCVFAGADMHIEAVAKAPNPAVHMTTGGGHNSNFMDAKVNVYTTLGDDSATLGPDEGVAWTWSDMSHVGDCKFDEVESLATGHIPLGIPVPVPIWTPVEAYVVDRICEVTGE